MNAIPVFRSQAAYDGYLELQRRQRLAQLVAERKISLAQLASLGPALTIERKLPSSEETCKRIFDIMTRKDVEQQTAHAHRFARTVRMVSGGAPGLGHR